MRAGEFPDGKHVLRAKIDMASPNMKMRDLPSIGSATPPPPHRRRVVHLPAVRLRPLPVGLHRGHHALDLHAGVREQPRALRLVPGGRGRETAPRSRRVRAAQPDVHDDEQAQAAQLVQEKFVSRLGRPTDAHDLGHPAARLHAEAIRAFCERIGVARRDSTVTSRSSSTRIRDDLNTAVPRTLAVLRPLKLVIDNYPEDQVEEFDAQLWPGRSAQDGLAQGPVLEGALHRARRLHGGPAQGSSASRQATRCACATRTW
jgi:glutaminyl-tRNA synthetase